MGVSFNVQLQTCIKSNINLIMYIDIENQDLVVSDGREILLGLKRCLVSLN